MIIQIPLISLLLFAEISKRLFLHFSADSRFHSLWYLTCITVHALHRALSAGASHSLELLIVWDGPVNMQFTFVMGV